MTDHDDDFDRMARAAGAALRRPAPEDGLMRVRAVRKRRQVVRTTMVGVAGLALLVAGVSLAKGDRTQVGDTPTTSPPTTTVAPVAVQQPLALSTAPDGYAPVGYALAGQGTRPAGGEATRGAVFVQRDATGAIVERVVVYLRDDIYRGEPGIGIPIPQNLAPAEGSALTDFTGDGVARLDYGLFERGYLILEAHYENRTSSGALTDAMQAIAASLLITPGQDLATSGSLPEGWSLATASAPPEEVVPSYFQAFEKAQPGSGNKITVDNRFLVDPGFPYWVAFQTMQPVIVRGHAGYDTFNYDYGTGGDTPQPTDVSSMLIWEEAPGHWVTLWAGGMTTEQALALADQLIPVPVAGWGAVQGAATSTTTTTLG